MFIPEIPNSSIAKEIEKLTKLCEKKAEDYGEDSSWFKPAMDKNDIDKLYEGWKKAVKATRMFK